MLKNKKEKKREREREKSLCFSLLLHSRMSVNKQKNEYIRSLRRLTSSFKILKYGSRLAMADGWSLDYKKTKDARVQNQDRNMIHSVVPPSGVVTVHLKVCLWTAFKPLLLLLLLHTRTQFMSWHQWIHYSINIKGRDQVSVFILTYLQYISMAWRVKGVYKQTLEHCRELETKKKIKNQQYKPTPK